MALVMISETFLVYSLAGFSYSPQLYASLKQLSPKIIFYS